MNNVKQDNWIASGELQQLTSLALAIINFHISFTQTFSKIDLTKVEMLESCKRW